MQNDIRVLFSKEIIELLQKDVSELTLIDCLKVVNESNTEIKREDLQESSEKHLKK